MSAAVVRWVHVTPGNCSERSYRNEPRDVLTLRVELVDATTERTFTRRVGRKTRRPPGLGWELKREDEATSYWLRPRGERERRREHTLERERLLIEHGQHYPDIYGRFENESQRQTFVEFIDQLAPQERRLLHSIFYNGKCGATNIYLRDARGSGIGHALEAFLLRRCGIHGGIVVEDMFTGTIVDILGGRQWS